MARALKRLGTKLAFVVYGMDTLDEITITGKTKVSELKDGRIRNYYITPQKFGIKAADLDDIKGGDVKENAQIVLAVLRGERSPRRDVVLLNAAAGLVAGSKARDFKDGIKMAAKSIDSGIALDKLLKLIELTNG